jgi:hypothetical protein
MTRLKKRKDISSAHDLDIRFGTPREVAEYRAKRIAEARPQTIIEVGAGAGFQTQEFAKYADVIAIDIDAERLARARMPGNVTVITGDALDQAVISKARSLAKGKTVIFLDPERPPAAAQRSLSEISPDIHEFIAEYGKISKEIAIELPPFLQDISLSCEREYLSVDGKLNRLTIYLGDLQRAELSVVRLPEVARITHDGMLPQLQQSDLVAQYIAEPDAAIAHAGLAAKVLPHRYGILKLGKRQAFLLESPVSSPFLRNFRIIATDNDVEKALARCGTLILHGSMEPEEQRALLRKLNKLCTGKRRMHLFLGTRRFLAVTPE